MDNFKQINTSDYYSYNSIYSKRRYENIGIDDVVEYYRRLKCEDGYQFGYLVKLVLADDIDKFKMIVTNETVDLELNNNILLAVSLDKYSNPYRVAKYLIQNSLVDLTKPDNFPIKIAAGNSLEITKLLVEAGVDITVDDNYPLKHAISIGSKEIIEYLVENGVDISAMNGIPIQIAIKFNKYETLEYLLTLGAKIEIGENCPIKYIIKRIHDEYGTHSEECINQCAKLLLESGANTDSLELEDLIRIIRFGDISLVKLLVGHGVNLSLVNDKKIDNKRTDVFLQYGIDPTQLARICMMQHDIFGFGFGKL